MAGRSRVGAVALFASLLLLAGCGQRTTPSPSTTGAGPGSGTKPGAVKSGTSQGGVYAADGPGGLSAAVRGFPARVYVPNGLSNSVDVIDQRTFKVIGSFPVGKLPQHVTPAYDLKTLYVDNDLGNSLTPIDPRTSRPKGPPIPVADPYNLYFTPDGRYAIVVGEAIHRLEFRNAQTMKLHHSLPVPCDGVDHADFTADGRYALFSCEFSGQLLKIDIPHEKVVRAQSLNGGNSSPQEIRLSPDGRVFYVADRRRGGVYLIDAQRFTKLGFIPTGQDAHGLFISRDAKLLYVSNRLGGSISVISFAKRKVIKTWHIPGGGNPDMGGISVDGKVLWASGRYNSEVYAISTKTGRVLARIAVGNGPHGLAVFPQPGRYSLGHTGIMR